MGDTATTVPVSRPDAVAAAIDHVVLGLSPGERRTQELAARHHALQFDRLHVFDALFGHLPADPPGGELITQSDLRLLEPLAEGSA